MVEGASTHCVCNLPQRYSDESGKLLGTLSLTCRFEKDFQNIAASRNDPIKDDEEDTYIMMMFVMMIIQFFCYSSPYIC